jgi:C4-dicarboxylate-specific signal transduction histidine kinase
LATLAVDYFWIDPLFAVTLDPRTLLWSVAFFVCAALSNVFSLYRRRTETALRRARDEMDTRIKERTAELNAALELLKSEVDERVRAEAAQRRMEQDVVRLNRIMTMGALTASIAHEINQPLTAITANGNAALLWLRRDPPALDETRESIIAMIAAVKRASAVVEEIRRLIEKGITAVEQVSINEVVASTLSLVRRDINLRGIDLKLQLDNALPAVHGSRVALQQVILNMIMNGIEAMEEISDRPRELIIKSETVNANGVAVTVLDSGAGLIESDTNKLFSPFFTTKPNGVGMGLAICRSIAEAMGGHMTASGRVPHGAAFSMVLPSSREPP